MSKSLFRAAKYVAVIGLATVAVSCSGAVSPGNPNAIQPETTLSINAEATIERAPDIAYVSLGVVEQADTAQKAMAANAKAMKEIFRQLKRNDIEESDIQTSNFSVHPVYQMVDGRAEPGQPVPRVQKIVGYTASNQVNVRVGVAKLGEVLDDLVKAGGNTFSGVRFALSDDSQVMNEARTSAMTNARERAELYAEAADLKIHRIVTINEGGSWNRGPQPMMTMARMEGAASGTPIAGGEVGYTSNVSVTFELK